MDNSAKASPAALREGSTLYYSLLFLEPKARECVANTLKLVSVISTTLYDVTEPQVAEKKIHWWHEELERLTKRSARHPACVTVQEYLHTPDAAKALLNVLSAAATERYTPPATEQSLNDMLISDYAARLSLIELSATHSNPVQNHELTAQALGKMHRLCTFSDRLQHGYSVLSDEYYKQFETAPEQLLNDQTAVTKLHSSIEQTSDTLAQAVLELEKNAEPTDAALPIYIMTKLRFAQSQLWQKKKPDLVREYLALTPLRKFFLAYRCKRKMAKLS